MRTTLTVVLGLVLAIAAGCSSSAEDKRREFRQDERERQEERRQDLQELREKEAREAEADTVVDVVADWEKLGECHVDGYSTDHDMIQIGLVDGRFSRLKLRVTGGDVVMQRVLVVFHDGEHFYPRVQLEFKDN